MQVQQLAEFNHEQSQDTNLASFVIGHKIGLDTVATLDNQ